MTEARITIKEIRAALKSDVALGHMTQETADHVSKLLGLDWKEEKHQKRKDMDCFLEDLHELFERYNVVFYFEGSYNGTVMMLNTPERFGFGDRGWFDKDFIALLPKMWKRTQKLNKLNFSKADNIDDIRPILKAIRQVDRKDSCFYVTDKKFEEMIKPYTNRKNEQSDTNIPTTS